MFQESIYKYIPSWTVYMLVCWRYIKVYSSIYILKIWPIDSFPAAPARLARLKAANLPLPLVHTRHTQVQAQLCLLFASFASFAPPPGPQPTWQGLAWQWRQWAGPLPARHCTRRILRPAAIHVVTPLFSPSIQRQDQRRNHNCRNCMTACVNLQNETWICKSTNLQIHYLEVDHNLAKENCK